jgi:hypothetical protein
MNFKPEVKAWILLISLALGTGIGVGYTAFLSGAGAGGAFVCGLGTAATNVYNALSKSPKEKAEKAKETTPPFPAST